MLGNVSMGELLVIFLVVLLVFGAKRIPEIARGLGTALAEFRAATREISREISTEATRPTVIPKPPIASGQPVPFETPPVQAPPSSTA